MVFVGQGTYGCVYRPPLRCKDGTHIPPGKISKLMVDNQANKEVKEYKIIEKIDPADMYYPGKPIICKADPADIRAKVSTNECNVYNKLADPNKYSLLFYDDGGIDLGKFVDKHLKKYLSNGNQQQQVALFFVNAHHLFKGLHLFAKNNFLHHDLKPGNIVFEPTSRKFKFIDFGLSTKSDKLISNIIAKNDYENFHWSYPLEFGLMDNITSYYYDNLTQSDIQQMSKDLRNIFAKNIKNNQYSIKPGSYINLFEFAQNINNKLKVSNIVVDGFIQGITEAKQSNLPFSDFVKMSVLSADTYALGFTMNHIINKFYLNNALSHKEYNEFRAVFEKMFDFNFMRRVSDTEVLLNLYEKVLANTGMLFKTQQVFNNHNLENIDDISTETESPAVEIKSLAPAPAPAPPKKRCPNGTRKNKKTGNCEPKAQAVAPAATMSLNTQNPVVNYASFTQLPGNVILQKNKRCPKGSRRNKKSGNCEPNAPAAAPIVSPSPSTSFLFNLHNTKRFGI